MASPVPGQDALDELSGVIGMEAAHKLARTFGGTSIYVPMAIGESHPLSVAIGRDAAELLSAWTGGSAISIPKQAERRSRVAALRQGTALTIAQIAVETDYSERHVYRLLREIADERQPDLFGGT